MSADTIPQPAIVELPKILDRRGNLSFIQPGQGIPFDIARVYWIYDVPGGEVRHGHAFRSTTELIVALSGSFDVVVTRPDGSEQTFHLNRSYYGLLVEPMTWRRLDNFSTNSVAMVLASTPYNPDDYIRDFDQYSRTAAAGLVGYQAFSPDMSVTPPDAFDSHAVSSIEDCRIVNLPRIIHPNGSLSVVDNTDNLLGFNTRRVYYVYDVPGDAERGGHSHHQCADIIIAASGSFDVTVTDGEETRRFSLNRPYRGLYLPAGIWRSLDNFSSGASSLVLTNELYSADDYVRDYHIFKQLTQNKRPR